MYAILSTAVFLTGYPRVHLLTRQHACDELGFITATALVQNPTASRTSAASSVRRR